MNPERELRLLLLEDMDADAELMIQSLQGIGPRLSWRHVKARETYERALLQFEPDVILADYSLPGFDGRTALQIALEFRPEVPVIIVSGSLLDEAALDLIRMGATDYVLKTNLGRLAPSVRRAVAEADDVRERKRAQELLAESEARFRGIVETAQEGIWMFSAGLTVYMNRRMREMIGLEEADLSGATVDRVIDVDSRAGFESRAFQLVREGAGSERFECQLCRNEGTRIWASIAMSRMESDPGGSPRFLAMVTDVAAQRKLQEQLMVSDRMASVGTLAASVAHEINNPLAAMVGNLQLAMADAGVEERVQDLREELGDSVACAERIRVIVRDLKIFGRAREERMDRVDVRAVLESSLRMARNEIHHRARVRWAGPPVPAIVGDEARLGQVFLNVLLNAAQAIDVGHAEGNEITIDTRVVDPGTVVVEIRDSGCGIPPAVLRHVFEPFFTTKAPGVGTGLGLAICRQILEAMGGGIDIESEVGHGTMVRVTLPVAHGSDATVPSPFESVAVAAPRRARVLVVDDEEMIGVVARRALGSEHDVVAETSGRAAILRIREGERFDVVLCDLMMPEMSGIEVLREIGQIDPRLARDLVFMSGGAFTPEARSFLAEVPNDRIEKPFDLVRLRNVVNTRLLPMQPE
jgi:PAS domain S-box-containing protein